MHNIFDEGGFFTDTRVKFHGTNRQSVFVLYFFDHSSGCREGWNGWDVPYSVRLWNATSSLLT